MLDVNAPISIENYLIEHGPFTHIVYSAGLNKLAEVSARKISFKDGYVLHKRRIWSS